jgi:hypothetical protein
MPDLKNSASQLLSIGWHIIKHAFTPLAIGVSIAARQACGACDSPRQK